MTRRVLIIGGYGNFGSFIAKSLASEKNIKLLIGGRSLEKAEEFCRTIIAENTPTPIALDIHKNLGDVLEKYKPDIVIHTSGPFQNQDYDVAQKCIEYGAHYIDLADAREFVVNIDKLNAKAKKSGVAIISGASSVPCLTSAIIDHYIDDFLSLEEIDYGITTAQKTNRGLATTAAILGYTGKPFETLVDSQMEEVYGWQNIHMHKYEGLGHRFLGNCDVPDLTLFPKRYPTIKTQRFYAGIEVPFIHIGLWSLSWLVRLALIKNLKTAAPFLLKMSRLFDVFGSDKSAFHMDMTGKDRRGKKKKVTFQIVARSGDGPYIPCTPAILLAKKLAAGTLDFMGATPCIGLITMDDYLASLSKLDINWTVLSD